MTVCIGHSLAYGPASGNAIAVPIITVIVQGGVVQDVIIENGPARVIIRDYDTEGADPEDLDSDANGERYVRADWRNDIPPLGG